MALVLSGDGSITGNPNITLTENVSIAGTVTYEDVTNVDSIGIVTARSGINITGGSLDVQGNTTITGTLVSSNGNITSEVDLTGISSSISDTAIDVFVYDTSKDSDGGAWRKRTSDTSWYNETLGTATRGSRKEFPAVAVIVTENAQVTIYDGDDPDLPMWMVFNGASGNLLAYTSGSKSTVMLNGKLANAAGGSNQRFRTIDFISDFHVEYASTDGRTNFGINISQRNSGSGITNYGNVSGNGLIDRNCNDVVMTVLPNAPIDPSTGLPVPTIAVGTEGGPSIIKDDGDVVDVIHTAYKNITQIFFTEDNLLAYLAAGTVNQTYGFHYIKIPSGDLDNGTDGREVGTHDVRFYNGDGRNYIPSLGPRAYAHSFIDGAIGYSLAPDGGLMLLEKNAPEDYENSSIAFINTDHNTGWMHGDIQGAFLSETTVGSLTGTNFATQATQVGTARLSSENYDNGDTSWSMVDASASDNGYLQIRMNGLTAGKSYYINITVDGNLPTDTGYEHRFVLNNVDQVGSLDHWNGSGAGDLTGTFIAASSTSDFIFYVNNFTCNVSNFQVRELAEEDRSIKNNGLAVFGTVTKTAVNTGAELVAYSGFTSSNFLRQPPNTDMNIGTSNAYEMIWYKISSTSASGSQILMSYEGGKSGTTIYGSLMNIRIESGKIHGWASTNNFSTYDDVLDPLSTADGNWHCAAWVRRGVMFELYIDGELIGSASGAVLGGALSDKNTELVLGGRKRGLGPGACEEPFGGSLALARMGKSAPSPEQIKRIYEDEKSLFYENAKATLYGSSDAVTALAHDDSTNLLYVGTPSGRSDFYGLTRVDHSTLAVATAISAHDGLIAQQ